MEHSIHTVGARRDPGDEDGCEEEEGTLGVLPCCVVELAISSSSWVALNGGHLHAGPRLLLLDREYYIGNIPRASICRDSDRVGSVCVLRAVDVRSSAAHGLKVDCIWGHHLGRHRNLSSLNSSEGISNGGEVLISRAEVVEVPSLAIDGVTSADIDEESNGNDDPVNVSIGFWFRLECCLPDRTVEGNDAPDIPLRTHPAPQGCITVHSLALPVLDEDVNKGRNERDSIAADEVGDFHLA